MEQTQSTLPEAVDDGGRGFDAHFGVCPICLESGMNRNIGSIHIMACDEHKVRWFVGSNLFSAWRHETEAVWRENAALLESYTEVDDEVGQIVSAMASAARKLASLPNPTSQPQRHHEPTQDELPF